MNTLAQGLLDEQKRVRALIVQYRSPLFKGAGNMTAMLMEKVLQEADKAIMDDDIPAMLTAFKNLKEFEE